MLVSSKNTQEHTPNEEISRVLAFATSPFFGVCPTLTELADTIYRLAPKPKSSAVVLGQMPRSRLLWEHNLRTGVLARRLAASSSDVNPTSAFVAGVMHDMGEWILLDFYGGPYQCLLNAHPEGSVRRIDAERHQMGFDHATLGARILRKWGLPAGTCDLVHTHHESNVIAWADRLAQAMEFGAKPPETVHILPQLEPELVEQVVRESERELERLL